LLNKTKQNDYKRRGLYCVKYMDIVGLR
jgi:hypothetical protein